MKINQCHFTIPTFHQNEYSSYSTKNKVGKKRGVSSYNNRTVNITISKGTKGQKENSVYSFNTQGLTSDFHI